jgi:hypothetical protein
MHVDERLHHFDRRSSLSGTARSDAALPSSIAKYALALRRISIAWRSYRFSRSSAFIFSAISVRMPARLTLSTSDYVTHTFRDCAVQPIFAAIDMTRSMLTLGVENQPHGPLADLRGKLVCGLAHDAPSYSRAGASRKHGAVHTKGMHHAIRAWSI